MLENSLGPGLCSPMWQRTSHWPSPAISPGWCGGENSTKLVLKGTDDFYIVEARGHVCHFLILFLDTKAARDRAPSSKHSSPGF